MDPEDLSAITVAKKIGMPAEQVFKTLLTTGGPECTCSRSFPAMPSWTSRSWPALPDLRKAEMVPLKDVQPLTGYIRGGVTRLRRAKSLTRCLWMRRRFCSTQISVSAGTRGTQLILEPEDYLRAAEALDVPS